MKTFLQIKKGGNWNFFVKALLIGHLDLVESIFLHWWSVSGYGIFPSVLFQTLMYVVLRHITINTTLYYFEIMMEGSWEEVSGDAFSFWSFYCERQKNKLTFDFEKLLQKGTWTRWEGWQRRMGEEAKKKTSYYQEELGSSMTFQSVDIK